MKHHEIKVNCLFRALKRFGTAICTAQGCHGRQMLADQPRFARSRAAMVAKCWLTSRDLRAAELPWSPNVVSPTQRRILVRYLLEQDSKKDNKQRGKGEKKATARSGRKPKSDSRAQKVRTWAEIKVVQRQIVHWKVYYTIPTQHLPLVRSPGVSER